MIERIAILTSTRPVRHRVNTGRGTKERIDQQACMRLAEFYDLIIIGSAASAKVYQRILDNVTTRLRMKFRLYDRNYFDQFLGPAPELDDPQISEGWRAILKENEIFFDLERKVLDEDFTPHMAPFNWRNIQDYVTDRRVTFITSRGDIYADGGA